MILWSLLKSIIHRSAIKLAHLILMIFTTCLNLQSNITLLYLLWICKYGCFSLFFFFSKYNYSYFLPSKSQEFLLPNTWMSFNPSCFLIWMIYLGKNLTMAAWNVIYSFPFNAIKDMEKNQVSRDFLHLIFGLLLWCASRFLCNYNNNFLFKIFFN